MDILTLLDLIDWDSSLMILCLSSGEWIFIKLSEEDYYMIISCNNIYQNVWKRNILVFWCDYRFFYAFKLYLIVKGIMMPMLKKGQFEHAQITYK